MDNREFKLGLERRTLDFAVQVVRFVAELKFNTVNSVLSKQLLKAATSIGANYREANRSESRADFTHKIAIVEKEAAETVYWLDIYLQADIADQQMLLILQQLRDEALELLKIFTTISKKVKCNANSSSRMR